MDNMEKGGVSGIERGTPKACVQPRFCLSMKGWETQHCAGLRQWHLLCPDGFTLLTRRAGRPWTLTVRMEQIILTAQALY